MNPFIFGNPIKDPRLFCGRRNEIRQITSRLLSSAHESVSVIGERRIGKTSLLNNLSNPEVGTSLGFDPVHFSLVYVDFQGLTDITPHRFWQRIFRKMSQSICDQALVAAIQKLVEQEEFDLFDLEDLFDEISNRGITTILFMDEFEYITQNPNFKGDFFGGLRALAIHHGVALVPATRRELVDLCHTDDIKGSPFFNIFANVVLRPFKRAEVDEMIFRYLEKTEFSCSLEERDLISVLGGAYPFFVQMAGYYLIEGKLQGLSGEMLSQFTSKNFNQQAESHYTYLWSHCSESEQITLVVILSLEVQKESRKIIPNIENITKFHARALQELFTLEKQGLITKEDGIYKLFSPSLEHWILQEVLAAPGEEESQESAEEWLKSSGQATPKEAKDALTQFKKKYWPVIGGIFKEVSVKHMVDILMELGRQTI